MMRRYLGIILAVMVSLSAPVFADTIGFIDMDKILLSYKDAKALQEKFEKKRADYQKLIEKNQKKIDKAKEKKKSDEEIQKLLKEIDEELRPKQEEILRQEGDAQRGLLAQIMSAARVIAKDNGIDVVVDKRVLYVGGYDLTDFVIDRLNQ